MKYVQIHELIAYPASNLNRDDVNRPKTVKIGETTRLRISSQSLKRAWRVSDVMSDAFPEMGIRTNKLAEIIEKGLVDGTSLRSAIEGRTEQERDKVAAKDAKNFGEQIDASLRKKSAADSDGDEEEPSDKKKGGDKQAKKKKELVFYTPAELEAVDKAMEAISKGEDFSLPSLSDGPFPVDMAMFGRMVANNPSCSCEAAVQVSHAFTVHKAVVEDDYFTAVDDLQSSDSTGAGHVNTLGFGSGLFYIYICVDFDLLTRNLGSEEEARKALCKLIETAATVGPSGKQNSFASRSYASYIMVEKGDKQPRSLASAFFNPVHGEDVVGNAISSFRRAHQNMDSVFGQCYDDCYEVNVPEGTGTMEGIVSFIG